MTRVVLGSASTGRLSVLRNAGIDPAVIVSGVDEDAVIAACPGSPVEVVLALAEAKAHNVVDRVGPELAADCVVIGCDSMLLLDGRLCGKPATPEDAAAQWRSMAGRSGELLTGHCMVRMSGGQPTAKASETGSTTVHFAALSGPELRAYITSGEPLGVAGGFTLDALGGWFVDRIEGDPSNVIGLSLPLTRKLLAKTGLPVAELWRTTRS